MNKSFILLDKNNNLQKNATVIVKFNYEGKDYLVYSVEENDQNSQIFVSKIILNSEGKYFIDNVLIEEKNKLNNIVYNIVILIPTDAQKGSTFEVLSKNLLDKFSVKLSSDIPELGIQEYFSNSSVAITSKLLVASAVKFYEDNLLKKEEPVVVPTWTAPVEATAPTAVNTNVNNVDTQTVVVPNISVPVQESPVVNTVTEPIVNPMPAATPVNPVVNNTVQPNPQAEKLAVVSDPSLGIGVTQPNVGKIKTAGYANTKYIVIGTVCLVVAIAIVVTAYILIMNMQ